MEWFTSDSHFGHANIIKHCNRPFSNILEMDEAILDGINSRVQPNDTLYHLGDFAWGKTHLRYRNQIRCRNVILILGNHDPQTKSGQPQALLHNIFTSVVVVLKISPKINDLKQPIVLNHYAMRTWDKSHYGSWNLSGHSHGTLPNNGSMSLDVGVDCHMYKPISLENVVQIIEDRNEILRHSTVE